MHLSSKKTRLFFVVVTVTLITLFVFLKIISSQKKAEIYMFLGDTTFGTSHYLHAPSVAEKLYLLALHTMSKEGLAPLSWNNYELARIAFIRGDLAQSLGYLNKETQHYPQNIKAYYLKGLVYGYLSHELLGIEEFKKFITYVPDSWAARNDLAWLQFRIGDVDGALKTLDPVIEKFSGTPWIENTYGALLLNKGLYKEALIHLTRGLDTLSKMTPEQWGRAYPGNDPRIYEEGLESMKRSFETNIGLAKNKGLK